MLSARQIVKGPAIVPVPTGAPAIGDGVADLHFDGRWQTGEGPAMAIFERTSSERLATLRLASREQLAAALASAERFSPGDADRAAMAERLERAASRIEGDVAQLVDVMQGETGASPYETVREIHLALQMLRRVALRLRHAQDTLGTENIDFDDVAAICADSRPLLVMTGARAEDIVATILPAWLSGRAAIVRSSLEAPLTTGLLYRHLVSASAGGPQLSLLHLDYALTEEVIASGRVRTLLSWLVPPAAHHV